VIRGALEPLNKSRRGAPKRTDAQRAEIERARRGDGPCGRPCGGCSNEETCND